MEDLERLVRVERRHDLGQRAEVAVDELAEPARVVERAGAGAAGDEELEAGRAERVLNVDDDESDAEPVVRRGRNRVLLAPALRVREALGVVDAPDLADAVGIPVRRQRKLVGHRVSVGTCFRRSSRERSPSPSVPGSRGRAAPRPAACSRCSPASAAARASPRSAPAAASGRRWILSALDPEVAFVTVELDAGTRGRRRRAARRRTRTQRCSTATGMRCCPERAVRPPVRGRRQGEGPRGARRPARSGRHALPGRPDARVRGTRSGPRALARAPAAARRRASDFPAGSGNRRHTSASLRFCR